MPLTYLVFCRYISLFCLSVSHSLSTRCNQMKTITFLRYFICLLQSYKIRDLCNSSKSHLLNCHSSGKRNEFNEGKKDISKSLLLPLCLFFFFSMEIPAFQKALKERKLASSFYDCFFFCKPSKSDPLFAHLLPGKPDLTVSVSQVLGSAFS